MGAANVQDTYRNLGEAFAKLKNAGYEPVTKDFSLISQNEAPNGNVGGAVGGDTAYPDSAKTNYRLADHMNKLYGTDAQAIAGLGLYDTLANQGEDPITSKTELRRRLTDRDNQLGGVGQSGGYIAANPLGGAADFINDMNAGIGSGIDALAEGTIGNLVGLVGGQDAKKGFDDLFTGEDLAIIPDIAEDIALTMIPGAGPGLMLAKNAVQQSDNILGGLTGVDQVTGQQLTDQQRLGQGLSGALGVGLAAIPGIGKMRNAVEAASNAGKIAAKEDAIKGAESNLEKAIGKRDDAYKSAIEDAKNAVKDAENTFIPREQTALATRADAFRTPQSVVMDVDKNAVAEAEEALSKLQNTPIEEFDSGLSKAISDAQSKVDSLKSADLSEFAGDYSSAKNTLKNLFTGGGDTFNRAVEAAEKAVPSKEGAKVTLRDRMNAFKNEMGNTPDNQVAIEKRLGQSLEDYEKGLKADQEAAAKITAASDEELSKKVMSSAGKSDKELLNKVYTKEGVKKTENELVDVTEEEVKKAENKFSELLEKAKEKDVNKKTSVKDKAKKGLRNSMTNPSSIVNMMKQNMVGLPLMYGNMALNYMGNGDYDSLLDAATDMNKNLLSGNPAALLPAMFPLGMKRMSRNLPGVTGKAGVNSDLAQQARAMAKSAGAEMPMRGDFNMPFNALRAGAAGDMANNAGYMYGINPEDYQFDSEEDMYRKLVEDMPYARNY